MSCKFEQILLKTTVQTSTIPTSLFISELYYNVSVSMSKIDSFKTIQFCMVTLFDNI